jgi:hypothetical protein
LVGLVVHGVERGMYAVSRHYGEPGGPTVAFSYTLTLPCQLLVMCPFVDRPGPRGREDPTPYAHARLAEMFTYACAAVDATLARSDPGPGHGFVQESELDGAIAFIDWYQYFSPRVVQRLGRERLLSAPAFRITEDEHGAIVMLLSAGPWEDFSRSRVAAHLGVTLRPVDAFNPVTGGQFRIPWR